MKSQYRTFTIGVLLAIVFAVLPLALSFAFELSRESEVIAQFASLAWLLVAVLLLRHRVILKTVSETSIAMGLPPKGGSLLEVIDSFAKQSARYHRANYALRLDRTKKGGAALGHDLSRIVNLAYQEVDALAVELSLFDEESGLWSQALAIGQPTCLEGQSMLDDEFDVTTLTRSIRRREEVLLVPLRFAGTLFGALRVEFKPDANPTDSDVEVLELLAAQGGILLVDSRFTDEVLRLRKLGDETTRAKTGFLANLSHEIRGPLGIILNGAELSLEGLAGEVTDAQREMLQMIKESGDHLLDLVNDVLDFAKVEAGKIAATPVELSVKQVLDDICSVVRTQAMAKGHELTLEEIEPTLGMSCDKRHARQMLINFLTNAIKYTPDGGTITVSALRDSEGRVRISVQDTGIGIPEQEKPKVFGAFERVEDEYAKSQGGTGLGMPLTRRLAEVNSGKVGFDSVHGEGSTFWVELPALEIEARAEASEVDDEELSAQGQGERVLLVDLASSSRKMLERYLGEHDFVVSVAESASDVVRQIRDGEVELAVIENDIPELSGEQIVSTIRAMPKGAGVPIVLLSSKAFVFDIERFLKLGVDRCLSKPVSLGEIALTARRLIDENRNLDEARPSDSLP